jgi:hypothetical protein
MQMKRTVQLLTILTLSAPLTAVAASDEKPEFSEVDADGDGKVSISEATEAGIPEEEAKREDIDNDDQLSKTDWNFVDVNPQQGGSGDS